MEDASLQFLDASLVVAFIVKENDAFTEVVNTTKDASKPGDPSSTYATLKWFSNLARVNI